MKLTIESTSKVVMVNDRIPCRVWEGVSERGVRVVCLIPRIAVKNGQDQSQFEAELVEQRAPSAEDREAFPLRMIL